LRNSESRSWFWVFETSESNNRRLWVCGKNQNQRTTSFGYFKNLKELLGFMEELAKNWSWSSFWAII
jgi:hypothetical protein